MIINNNNNNGLEEIEFQILLEGIFRFYGYDFRDYSFSSLKRRIWLFIRDEELQTVSGLLEKALHDKACMERLLLAISINVTAMFRDPGFYLAFRKKALPFLSDLPFIRIWHVGCSSGEEVYSMAILLHEEGLYEKSRIYATDMNEVVLNKAKEGVFSLDYMKEYTMNYINGGGKKSFSEYYSAKYNNAIFARYLQNRIVWAQHNLATDSSFNEFNIIICRNVMIYFNKSLQNRVHKLLYDSLALSGILGLGRSESIKFTPYENCYEELNGQTKLFRKVR